MSSFPSLFECIIFQKGVRKIITAVIAEFNPLHKGHHSLMQGINDGCIVILSSNFTQRGSPALTDKFIRADMAMKAGADLVIELPFLFACSAGQDFARGAVDIIARSGLADSIAFGMEDLNFPFEDLADEINCQPEKLNFGLRFNLQKGISYSKAHALALEDIMPGAYEFVSKPNNMLALSYTLEIKRHGCNLKILPVKRTGDFRSRLIREDMKHNLDMMPEFAKNILNEAMHNGRVSDESKLWPLLQSIFIRSKREDLRRIYGIDEGIEGLFIKHWRDSHGLDDFIGRCVCARYTRAHIRRRLIYILLGLERYDVTGAVREGVPYVRILAFNDRGRMILRERSDSSCVHVITRLKDAEGRQGKFFAQTEFRASLLYELLTDKPDMNHETHRVLQFLQ